MRRRHPSRRQGRRHPPLEQALFSNALAACSSQITTSVCPGLFARYRMPGTHHKLIAAKRGQGGYGARIDVIPSGAHAHSAPHRGANAPEESALPSSFCKIAVARGVTMGARVLHSPAGQVRGSLRGSPCAAVLRGCDHMSERRPAPRESRGQMCRRSGSAGSTAVVARVHWLLAFSIFYSTLCMSRVSCADGGGVLGGVSLRGHLNSHHSHRKTIF
jgi:hypothetical protein